MNKLKIGDVVYFAGTPLNSNKHIVKWGVINFIDEYITLIDFYEVKNPTLINGKSIFEFKPEEEWKPLPKKWSYNTKLFEQNFERLPLEFKKLHVDKPEDILYAIEKGWLIKSTNNIHRTVTAEIDRHKGWRLRWETYIICNEPKYEVGVYFTNKEAYVKLKKTYEEAKEVVDELIKEDNRKRALSDEEWSIEEIDHTLKQWSDRMKINANSEKYIKTREFLVNLPDVFNVVTRVFGNNLQWKYDRQREWKNI